MEPMSREEIERTIAEARAHVKEIGEALRDHWQGRTPAAELPLYIQQHQARLGRAPSPTRSHEEEPEWSR